MGFHRNTADCMNIAIALKCKTLYSSIMSVFSKIYFISKLCLENTRYKAKRLNYSICVIIKCDCLLMSIFDNVSNSGLYILSVILGMYELYLLRYLRKCRVEV